MQNIIIMGPSGCGKTTLARALGTRLGLGWADGDDFHDAAAIAKMSRGEGLTDEDRWPWFKRIATAMSGGVPIMACSALKTDHRDWLRANISGLGFVYPVVSEVELTRRLTEREGHYAGTSLIQSQLDALEPPDPSADVLLIAPGTKIETSVDLILSWAGFPAR